MQDLHIPQISLAGIAAVAFLPAYSTAPAMGATVYTYAGNPFVSFEDSTVIAGSYDTTMRVTGSFTVASPLAGGLSLQDISASLLDFSFNDGRNTLTRANAHVDIFNVTTDLSGALTQWQIGLSSPFPETVGLDIGIEVLNFPPGGFKQVLDSGAILDCTQVGMGKCIASAGVDDGLSITAGTFSSLTETPLPGALPLFATGLGALGVLGWRRKKKLHA